MVAFADTPNAVRCALAAVEAARTLGLELRAGVHVGEVTRMDERDFSGVQVHVAERLPRPSRATSWSRRPPATTAKGRASFSRTGAGRP